MTASFLSPIDWTRPWLLPLRSHAQPILQSQEWRSSLNIAAATQDLRNHRGLPIHFVPQEDLPRDTAYEAFISATGGVPTRSNLHDFFNALIWLAFPKIKAQLNAVQAAEIARSPGAKATQRLRGKVRDAATIFDENAALLITSDEGVGNALRGHRWRELFVSKRAAFSREYEVRLFGHALIEKLVAPYKAITAHTWIVITEPTFFAMPFDKQTAWIDLLVAKELAKGLSTADFTPLPVLGLPGWWSGQDEDFYADISVFRPKRQVKTFVNG